MVYGTIPLGQRRFPMLPRISIPKSTASLCTGSSTMSPSNRSASIKSLFSVDVHVERSKQWFRSEKCLGHDFVNVTNWFAMESSQWLSYSVQRTQTGNVRLQWTWVERLGYKLNTNKDQQYKKISRLGWYKVRRKWGNKELFIWKTHRGGS